MVDGDGFELVSDDFRGRSHDLPEEVGRREVVNITSQHLYEFLAEAEESAKAVKRGRHGREGARGKKRH